MNDPQPLIIANFKANKTWDELAAWLEIVSPKAADFSGTVILCPSAPFISEVSQKVKTAGIKIKIGSQDISQFNVGAYTGEFAASQITGQIDFALIGHSERRRYFGEDEKILTQKVQNCQKAKIEPIFCIQDSHDFIPQGVRIVAYEPPFAIGTGNPDTPQNTKAVSEKLKTRGDYLVLYGGSVSPNNAQSFLEKNIVDGLLIGSASLNPLDFTRILETAKLS